MFKVISLEQMLFLLIGGLLVGGAMYQWGVMKDFAPIIMLIIGIKLISLGTEKK